jgi:hypothetical protein
MKSVRAVGCLLAALAFSVSVALAAVDGTISGRVVDERGVPVKHIVLEYKELHGIPSSGTTPQIKTDENGHFSIHVTVGYEGANGQIYGLHWAVFPHDDWKDNYYTNPFNRFYHIGHAEEVNLTPDSPNAVIEIKLARGAAIKGKITDAVTGNSIEHCSMDLAWTADPTRAMGGGMGSSYRWLVPADTGITLTIRAHGYKPQVFKDITAEPGQDRVLDIQLQPEATADR